MVVTFQIQIDPLTFHDNTWEPNTSKVFTKAELGNMKTTMDDFVDLLDVYGEYIRAEMYVDREVYRG